MKATRIARFVAIGIAAVALFSWIVMSLWNWIVAPATGWHVLDYWQALGLLLLMKILFGRWGARGPHWKRRMLQRYEAMTPEEREKFREGMRCGFRYRGDSGDPTPVSSKL